MASAVDICNMALAHLGDEATITSIEPPEGSAQADHCARFYPQAKQTLLTRWPWSFATQRATLAKLVTTVPGYDYVYAVPSKCLRIIRVYRPGSEVPYAHEPPVYWNTGIVDEARVILTAEPLLAMTYISSQTSEDLFPAMFCDALAWLLASMLAGPVIRSASGSSMAVNCMKFYEDSYQKAILEDLEQKQMPIRYVPLGLEDYHNGEL